MAYLAEPRYEWHKAGGFVTKRDLFAENAEKYG